MIASSEISQVTPEERHKDRAVAIAMITVYTIIARRAYIFLVPFIGGFSAILVMLLVATVKEKEKFYRVGALTKTWIIKRMDLGEQNKAYYDEKLKCWIFSDTKIEEDAKPPTKGLQMAVEQSPPERDPSAEAMTPPPSRSQQPARETPTCVAVPNTARRNDQCEGRSLQRYYQVDYSVSTSGDAHAGPEKRIRFRFGIANNTALDSGKRGAECRGCEQEVMIVWSVDSGKVEVEFCGNRTRTFLAEQRGSLVLPLNWFHSRIIVDIPEVAPVTDRYERCDDTWRKFDLWINGESFSTLPKINQLGIAPDTHQQMIAGAPYVMDDYLNRELTTILPAGRLATIYESDSECLDV